MSDADHSGGDADVADTKTEDSQTPSGVNTDIDLAGDTQEIVVDNQKAPETPRGTKRRLSGEETKGAAVPKRVASENNDEDACVTNIQIEDSIPKDSPDDTSSKPPDESKGSGNAEATNETGGERKKVVVIEISDDSSDSSICAVDSYQATAAEVKRIRGDYSSSSDYSSDSSSSCDDDSVVLNAKRPRTVPRRAQLYPRAARTDEPKLNKAFREQDMMDKLSAHWAQSEDLSDGDVALTCTPFKHCLLHNILSNPEIINNMVDDMNTLDWSRKKMDLYEFHQTTDLANLTWQRSIRGIYHMLNHDVMPWISKVTGLKLTHTSASCSLYGPGDHLLVHDDLLADRKVAFILYLAPWTLRPTAAVHNGEQSEINIEQMQGGWTSAMGGALELLECDETRQPTKVVRTIVPRNNTLAFFQVTTQSFHQVSEVRSLEFPRLSINGWFHGPDAAGTTQEEPERHPPEAAKPHTEVAILSSWLTTQYMAPRTRLQIQQQMEKASEISLQQFLLREKYDSVLQHLQSEESEWEPAGPANQRRYDLLKLEPLEALEQTHPLREFVKLITSNGLYRFLHDCTDLVIKSHFHFEVQRWRANSFTVLPPKEAYSQNQLDLVMYMGFPEHAVCGGITTYVAPEEENAPPLVSLEPRNNALNLVFADAHTARFTKHVSGMTMRPDECFYIVTCSYKEEQP